MVSLGRNVAFEVTLASLVGGPLLVGLGVTLGSRCFGLS